jgi:hypothetical protein
LINIQPISKEDKIELEELAGKYGNLHDELNEPHAREKVNLVTKGKDAQDGSKSGGEVVGSLLATLANISRRHSYSKSCKCSTVMAYTS